MMDRNTLRILLLFVLVTAAAALWRLSLLPDWTKVPFTVGRNGPHVEHGLVLLVPPLVLLFLIAINLGTRWLISGPDEAIQAYQKRSRLPLLVTGAMVTVMQFFVIGRSLDYGNGLNGDGISRCIIAVSGILVMAQSNNLPKLPWISSRFARFQLDPWRQTRARRFAGRLGIVYGLGMIAAAIWLPSRFIAPLVFASTALYLGVIVWHSFRLKREVSLP